MKSSRKSRRAARRLFRMCMVDGTFDETKAAALAGRVATSGRGRSLSIMCDFLRLVRIDRSRHTALIESAAELPDDIRRDVSARLEATYGTGLKTTFAVNPALVGGMRIKVGSDVYDGSVRARLAALEARL
jgi:F-type H+-transporting ATPase subunit delta